MVGADARIRVIATFTGKIRFLITVSGPVCADRGPFCALAGTLFGHFGKRMAGRGARTAVRFAQPSRRDAGLD
jgi:hypothetical protein